MSERVVELLAELVAIPSVNPRAGGEIGGETAVARHLAGWADGLGLSWTLDEVLPGRHNIYVEVPGTLDGRLLLQTHTDTVNVDAMTVAPFELTRDGDVLRGRGACDAKGQLAVFCAALEEALADDAPHHPVLLAACIDEEEEFEGVLGLVRHPVFTKSGITQSGTATSGTTSSGTTSSGSAPPEDPIVGALVGEPTSVRPVIAHKGVVRGTITVEGPGGHSSKPTGKPNPITTAAEIITWLATEEAERLAGVPDDLVGPATLTVTMINGGTAINIIPRRTTLCYDRRVIPGEDPHQIWADLKDAIESRWDATVDKPFLLDAALPPAEGSAFSAAFTEAVAAGGGEGGGIGVAYGSDASKIARHDVPAILFGAGSIEAAHTPDEFVPHDELVAAVAIVRRLLTSDIPV